MRSPSSRIPKALPPDVKAALQRAVDHAQNQGKVAEALKCSRSTVSLLLRDAYPGDVAGMEERIRGAYMAETVNCPVMGELGRNHCLEYQKRPLAFTNPTRVALHAACKTCPNRREPS